MPTTDIPDEISRKIGDGRFEFSEHATDQAILRGITVQEVREALRRPELIEYYSHDKHGPSCLMLGSTNVGRPLHIQCSDPSRPLVKIITLYEPDPARWADARFRKVGE